MDKLEEEENVWRSSGFGVDRLQTLKTQASDLAHVWYRLSLSDGVFYSPPEDKQLITEQLELLAKLIDVMKKRIAIAESS